MSKKKSTTRRPTRLDYAMQVAAQDAVHLSTADASRRRGLLRCEIAALDAEYIELTVRLANLKVRRNDLLARVTGITTVIAAR